MRIVIIGPAYPYRGGIADTNESFCASLLDQGHEASIVTFSLQYPEFIFPGKTQFSTDPKPINILIERHINSINPLTWIKTSNVIKKIKPDLVIVRFWLPYLGLCLGSIIRLLPKGIKKIAMCDNVVPHEARRGDHFLTQYFLNAFDACITLSKTTLRELDKFIDKPRTYYPHPINTNLGDTIAQDKARKFLSLLMEGKYLLFFGLIRKYKGLDLTIKALGLDRIKALDITLLIVGEFYDDKDKYLELIKTYKLDSQVIIVDDFVSTEELKYYFCAADMVIQTYHTASQSGITQMAFHFDCPILVTDVGGLSEVVVHKEVGYVCKRDPENIADSITDYFLNYRKDGFGERIKLHKEKFTWKKFSEKVFSLYDII